VRNLNDFWSNSEYSRENYVEKYPTDEIIRSVENYLGYKLPASYVAMMKHQNGGMPRFTCFPTSSPTSWAEDHIAITGIFGIGTTKAYSIAGEMGGKFMHNEWGYPDYGIYICDCPSAGHDMILLDYRKNGSQGEPQVVHVDQEEDYRITFLAETFEAFVDGLVVDEDY